MKTSKFLSKKKQRNKPKKQEIIYIFDDNEELTDEFKSHFSFQVNSNFEEKDIELKFEEENIGPEPDIQFDVVNKILNSGFVDGDKTKMVCLVEFLPRPTGFKPENKLIRAIELKKYAPRQLAEYYESKLLRIN